MGSSDLSVAVFDTVRRAGHNIIALYTRAPAPSGRGHKLTPTETEIWGNENNIPVLTPRNFKDAEDVVKFKSFNADVALVVAYGVILPDEILSAPKLGCINIHPSLLPKYRGPSPIASAIINGDTETGVCLMKLDSGVDTGDVLSCEKMEISNDETLSELTDRIKTVASKIANEYLAKPDLFTARPQTGTPSMTTKITKEILRADFTNPTKTHNLVRAYSVRARFGGTDVKITKTKLTNGVLEVLRLTPSGGKEMDMKSFLNGHSGNWENI
jgi:methionyl-tRNA formyltransferase